MKDFGHFQTYWLMYAGLVKTLSLELFETCFRYVFLLGRNESIIAFIYFTEIDLLP